MSTRFAVGDKVHVRAAFPPGHIRAPVYTRNREGAVVWLLGAMKHPEAMAYGRDTAPEQPVYRVRFEHAALWARRSGRGDGQRHR